MKLPKLEEHLETVGVRNTHKNQYWKDRERGGANYLWGLNYQTP